MKVGESLDFTKNMEAPQQLSREQGALCLSSLDSLKLGLFDLDQPRIGSLLLPLAIVPEEIRWRATVVPLKAKTAILFVVLLSQLIWINEIGSDPSD
jgi:hypothetical protein